VPRLILLTVLAAVFLATGCSSPPEEATGKGVTAHSRLPKPAGAR